MALIMWISWVIYYISAVACMPATTISAYPSLVPRFSLKGATQTVSFHKVTTLSPAATSFPRTVSSCIDVKTPYMIGAPGCLCSNWPSTLPYLPGSSSCDYSVIRSQIHPPTDSSIFDSATRFPYTMTSANDAIVAYASRTIGPGGGPALTWSGVGASTILQVGTSVIVAVDTVAPAQTVGQYTGDTLYTAVSSRLDSACPSVTSSQTVTKCADISPLTGIPALYGEYLEYGNLDFELTFVKYSEPDIRESLIASIAATLRAASLYPGNTRTYEYNPDPCPECVDDDPPTGSLVSTHVPQTLQVQILKQTAATDGNVSTSDMQLQLVFVDSSFDLACSSAAFALDAIGVLSLIPPLSFLAPAVAAGAFGFSLTCFLNADLRGG